MRPKTLIMQLDKKDKKPRKLKQWFVAKVEAVKAWYNKDDNYLRKVRFPGTRLPFLNVVLEFLKRFVKGRTVDRAAGVAFNFFIALFPLILFFFTLIGNIRIPYLDMGVRMLLYDFFIPDGTYGFVTETIDDIMNQEHDGLLSLSIILCLVFGSGGIVAFFNGFRNVYADYVRTKALGVKDWLRQRLFAIFMLVVIGALIIVSVLLISMGGRTLRFLVIKQVLEGGSFTFFLFSVLRWVVGIFALCFGIALLYYFGNKPYGEQYQIELKKRGPNGEVRYRDFVLFSPGTILATILFVFGTIAFNTYISNFSRYDVLYGSVGALIILLLWIWVIAILILAGNDLNSSIRRETMNLSSAEDVTRRKKIVIDDLRKHIVAYQTANENRDAKIEQLKKSIKQRQDLIVDLEEKKKDYELIIKAYMDYAEWERKSSDEQYEDFDPTDDIEAKDKQD